MRPSARTECSPARLYAREGDVFSVSRARAAPHSEWRSFCFAALATEPRALLQLVPRSREPPIRACGARYSSGAGAEVRRGDDVIASTSVVRRGRANEICFLPEGTIVERGEPPELRLYSAARRDAALF